MLSFSIVCTSTFKSAFVLCLIVALTLPGARSAMAAGPELNINQANAAEIAEKLSGIGPVKARAIVTYREQYGPFSSLDELINVKGIGPRTLEKIRAQIVVTTDLSWRRAHDAVAPIAAQGGHSQADIERETRRAVRSVIAIARGVTPAASR